MPVFYMTSGKTLKVSVGSLWRCYRLKSGKRSLKIERRFECNLLEVSTSKTREMTAILLLAYSQPKNIDIT